MSAGEDVELELLRDGERRTIEIELGERPDESG
jgi:S1-C subfamily serine protease